MNIQQIVRFNLEDMIKSVEEKKGVDIISDFNASDPHCSPTPKDTHLSYEMNHLMWAILEERGMELPDRIEGFNLFRLTADRTKDLYYVGNDQEAINSAISPIINDIFKGQINGRSVLEKEFLYILALFQAFKTFNHLYLSAFDARYGLNHQSIQEVLMELDIGGTFVGKTKETNIVQQFNRGILNNKDMSKLSLQINEQYVVEKSGDRWIIVEKLGNRWKTLRSIDRLQYIPLQEEKDRLRYIVLLQDDVLYIFQANTSPYQKKSLGKIDRAPQIYSALKELFGRISRTAEFQCRKNLLQYDGNQDPTRTRSYKYITFNNLFLPGRFKVEHYSQLIRKSL